MELGLQMHRVARLVSSEDRIEVLPHAKGRDILLHDEVEELIRNGGIQPHEDCHIFFDPFRVIVVRLLIKNMTA